MTDMTPLLIELGTEELPVKALPGLAQALLDGVVAALDRRGIASDREAATPLYTPRRIAVLLPGVAISQPEQRSEVAGPYLDIALDADGAPTKALLGFAAKAGVDWQALEKASDARGERFVHRAVRPGAATASLLPEVLREAVGAMPIPRPMRWGAHAHAFARPLHWLVLLLGDDVVDAELFGVRADRMSRGHRFLHDKTVWIARPADYVDALRASRVLVDPDERRRAIVDGVAAAAAGAGGHARIDADNLAQVLCLVEWPHAVLCAFEPAFLAVPHEALVATMEANQKFFPVHDAQGALDRHFVGVANIAPADDSRIRQGYERVIRPRFSDARFFFVEDMKQGLVSMDAGLAHVTYQASLGTIADKVSRVAMLAGAIAPQVGVDAALARRAAQLSKADLQSRLVNEFPELQGIAGRHYAMQDASLADLGHDGRHAVAEAIDEAYRPRFAGDAIAASPLGRVLAIAERLDTLAGGFAAGLKPTGNKDPFALRRSALGLGRSVVEGGLELDLHALLALAVRGVAGSVSSVQAMRLAKTLDDARRKGVQATTATATHRSPTVDDLAPQVYDFIVDRLRGYYADRGVPATHFAAVAALRLASLHDMDRRIDAIGGFAALPEAAALAAADKRIRNILRKAGDGVVDTVDHALLLEPAERALAEAVDALDADITPALARGDYPATLARLARLRPQVDAFFDGVMVNVDDPALRDNRLALLRRVADRLGRVAAIEHLSA